MKYKIKDKLYILDRQGSDFLIKSFIVRKITVEENNIIYEMNNGDSYDEEGLFKTFEDARDKLLNWAKEEYDEVVEKIMALSEEEKDED